MTFPVQPRPEFATVMLATDLMRLEEDFARLQHRAQSKPASVLPSALKHLNRDEIARMFAGFANQCNLTRTWLMDDRVSFDAALVVLRMCEAAFDVARQSLNGVTPDRQLVDEPIPYTIVDNEGPTRIVAFDTRPLLTRDEHVVDEVPC